MKFSLHRSLPYLLLIVITGACVTRRNVPLQIAASVSDAAKPYLDLEPGQTLLIVVPLLKSEGFLPKLDVQKTEGTTITLASTDVIGYTTSSYAITKKKQGKVRLELASAEETKDGKTVPHSSPRALPFKLPQRAAHIRLLYLIRYSASDHGTAILASERLNALNAFTQHVIDKPGICTEAGDVFCSWIPAGVGIRTENP